MNLIIFLVKKPSNEAALLQVGAGDPHAVVFHLPGKSTHIHPCKSIDNCSAGETSCNIDVCISAELLVVLVKLLMKYLMDDSVKIVDMASQTLRVSVFN